MGYCVEEDVYDETGLNLNVVKKLSGKDDAEVEALINKYIARADLRIKRLLGVPITIRKEYHEFDYNNTVELGPYDDEFEFFGTWDPENCVEAVYAVYRKGSGRVKLPYPKNCDDLTQSHSDMTASGVTLSSETSIVKCGTISIKGIFAGVGNFYFPSAANLNKNIDPWDYIGFWFRTSDKTATFTIKLYDKDGNSVSHTFTLDHNDTWEIVALRIDSFTGTMDWSTVPLQKIEISSDKACTIYFDNFNFNDGIFWSYPEGLICWSDPDSTPWMQLYVTYAYDPYKINTPEDVKECSAKLAGVKLLDYCLGARMREVGFKLMTTDMSDIPEKASLEITRGRLIAEANRIMAGIGHKTYEGIGTA